MADLPGRPAVEARDVVVEAGGARLLKGVSFACRPGEVTLVCGTSGSGKTTLLRTVNGLCLPVSGHVVTLGTVIPGRPRREARRAWRLSGTVLQELGLFETRTARQNVELALRAAGCDRRTARQRAGEWLTRLELGAEMDRYPCCLSGGQRQRVALARALATGPRLLVLDEPTSALDPRTSGLVYAAIRELVALGTAVLMSSHRIDECLPFCDQVIELSHGHLVRQERCGAGSVPAPRPRPERPRAAVPEYASAC